MSIDTKSNIKNSIKTLEDEKSSLLSNRKNLILKLKELKREQTSLRLIFIRL